MADFTAGAALFTPILVDITLTPGTHVATALSSEYQIKLVSGRVVPEEDVSTRSRAYVLLAADITNLTTVANQCANRVGKETLTDYTGTPSIRIGHIIAQVSNATDTTVWLKVRYHVLLQSAALFQAQLDKVTLGPAATTAWNTVMANVLADIRTFDGIL